MSIEDLPKELSEKANEPSIVDNVPRQDEGTEPNVLYPCVCSECGGNRFKLIDSGIFTESPVLGITGHGEIGCSQMEFDGDYELGIFCCNCGHQICSDYSLEDKCEEEFLLKWAKSNGEARTAQSFSCPQCDSQELHQIEVNLEISYKVVAVCESDTAGNNPLVALSHLREIIGGGSYRYRCSRGHELARDDGSPVETAEELLEWLKAHSTSIKG